MTATETVRIGVGAGFAGDRIDPAVDLVREGELNDVVLECLAERTIALGQQRRRQDPDLGHDTRAAERFRALLPLTLSQDTRLISNLGAANPLAAGRLAADIAHDLDRPCRVAVVTGDDVLDQIDENQLTLEDGRPLGDHGELVSANAYLGAEALMPAMESGAQVVITGRVADPSLFVAPLVHRLGWSLSDVDRIAAGTVIGHLLECGTQATGGYYADPGTKDVPRLDDLGYPWADVAPDGSATLGKLHTSGGQLDRRTVREQLLYEISDPGAYLTPDVSLDLYGVRLTDLAADRVGVVGAAGRPRPDQLKVSVGYRAGFQAEAGISYAGPECAARAQLAADILRSRLRDLDSPLRIEVLGTLSPTGQDPDSARLRVAARHPSRERAEVIAAEVEALYTNGPAGGGGVRTTVREVVGIVSTLMDRSLATPTTTYLEA